MRIIERNRYDNLLIIFIGFIDTERYVVYYDIRRLIKRSTKSIGRSRLEGYKCDKNM